MSIYVAFIILVIGFILLVKGADFFVSGASSIANILGVSSLVIGLTVVSFGTSLPEAAVSISSQISGLDDVSLGNVIGSTIFNLLPVLGISALITPLFVKKDLLKRDFPLSIIVTIVLILMFFLIPFNNNHLLTRFEGAILFISLILYIIWVVKASLKEIKLENEMKLDDLSVLEKEGITILPKQKAILYTTLGLIGVVGGGILVTNGAKEIALFFGMSEWLVGLTIVSIGTSLPELITSIIAALKNEVDIAVGNVVGSNLFNILFILGASSLIRPIHFNKDSLFDLLFLTIASLVVYLLVLRKKHLGKLEGFIMLLMYLLYFSYIVLRELAIF